MTFSGPLLWSDVYCGALIGVTVQMGKRKLSADPKLDSATKKWRVRLYSGFEDYNDAEDACRAQHVATAEANELHKLDSLMSSWGSTFVKKVKQDREHGRISFGLPAVSSMLLGRLRERCTQM